MTSYKHDLSDNMTTLTIPVVWKTLIDITFPEGLKGIPDGKLRSEGNVGDPQPYYDDTRYISVRLSDSTSITVFLNSGQGNYWGAYDIWKGSTPIQDSDVLESFDALQEELQGALRDNPNTAAVADELQVIFV